MSFGERLKEARTLKGLTQKQLAEKLNIGSTTVTGYEKGNSEPNMNTISKIMDILEVDANYLFQDETRELYKNETSPEEFEKIIKKYRILDDSGKKHIDYELDRECKRIEEIRQQRQYIEILKTETSTELIPTRVMIYCQRLASAGNGEYLFNDIPTDFIKVKDTPESQKADFVIGVNGDSMEPDYCDGEKVFVEKTPDIDIGEVGVFVRGDECFIKECGKNGLISRNQKYSDVEPFSGGIKVVGRVIGKVDE